MNISPSEVSVGELVRAVPARARVFEKLRIDYCCGGKKSLAEACQKRDLDPVTVLRMLEALDSTGDVSAIDADAMSLSELCNHIESTHHNYLREELPRLDFITRKVAAVHGGDEPRLVRIREVFEGFAAELAHHTQKEEQVIFPRLRAMESAEGIDVSKAELQGLLIQMEREHDSAGDALAQFRELTEDFTPPSWACNTFRALYDSLAQLEQDMHQHVHKENNVLFPRALAAAS